MKLLHKILAAAAGILALGSCVEDAIDPLSGRYEKPVVYQMNTLVSQTVEKGERTRTFTVEVSGDGASLLMKFVGDKYFLHDAGYTAAPADAAKVGNYIVGGSGSAFTLNGKTVSIDSGTLVVASSGEGYSFSGMLWLADENIIEIKASVPLAYEPDPEPVVLSTVLSAASNLANGVSTVTMQLAQDGIRSEMDMTTYQTIWHGEGNYLAIDLYSADGYLHEGTYFASAAGGVVGEGQFGIGYDTTVDWGWGPMEMKDWGTCWWTVSGGAATAQKILEGTVTVTKKGGRWVIELKSGEGKEMIWAEFEGEIPQLTESGGDTPAYTEFAELLVVQPNQEYDETYQPTGRYTSLTIKVGTEGMYTESSPNQWGGTDTVIKGTGQVLSIDFYTADGTLAAGEYTACEVGGTVGAGEFGIGYDVEMWGMQMVWGTCLTPYENDTEGTVEKITDGTVTVEVSGDEYTITLESSSVNAEYVGTLTL